MRPTFYTIRVRGRWFTVECSMVECEHTYRVQWRGIVLGLPEGESITVQAKTLVDLMENVKMAMGDMAEA